MVNYQWSIFMIDFDPVIGSEQAGRRPALAVSEECMNQTLPVITVLPLTSYKGRRIYPAEVFLTMEDSGLSRDSIVMAHQIRTISKKRLGKLCGEITDELIQEDIRNALRVYLDLVV